MYKYFILLAFFSIVVATNTKVNPQLNVNGSTSGETWATGWETVSATLYSPVVYDYNYTDPHSHRNVTDAPDYPKVEICTQIQGQIKLQIKVMNNETKTEQWVDVFVPASATLDHNASYCGVKIGNASDYKHGQTFFYQSMISLVFYSGTFRLNIHFTNSTMLGSAGWLQFAIYRVDFIANLDEFKSIFPSGGLFNVTGDGYKDRWWKKLGTVTGSSFQCNHMQTVNVGNDMQFSIQNMQISALNEGCNGANGTYPGNMCDFDYEQDDALAVVIGTVQTGFVLVTLVIYLIYLKRRGPVKVPDWIIEPAMRNATVQPIDDAAYERKMSQVSNGAGPNSDPMPTKRRTLNGNDDVNKY